MCSQAESLGDLRIAVPGEGEREALCQSFLGKPQAWGTWIWGQRLFMSLPALMDCGAPGGECLKFSEHFKEAALFFSWPRAVALRACVEQWDFVGLGALLRC